LAGKDWESEIRQRGREKKLLKELGLAEEEAKPSKDKTDKEDEEENMEEEE